MKQLLLPSPVPLHPKQVANCTLTTSAVSWRQIEETDEQHELSWLAGLFILLAAMLSTMDPPYQLLRSSRSLFYWMTTFELST